MGRTTQQRVFTFGSVAQILGTTGTRRVEVDNDTSAVMISYIRSTTSVSLTDQELKDKMETLGTEINRFKDTRNAGAHKGSIDKEKAEKCYREVIGDEQVLGDIFGLLGKLLELFGE